MDFLQPFAAIVLVMGLLGAALYAVKRRGGAAFRLPGMPAGDARQLEVLERLSLGPQHTLHLVRVGERRVLIATAPGSSQVLNTE